MNVHGFTVWVRVGAPLHVVESAWISVVLTLMTGMRRPWEREDDELHAFFVCMQVITGPCPDNNLRTVQ